MHTIRETVKTQTVGEENFLFELGPRSLVTRRGEETLQCVQVQCRNGAQSPIRTLFHIIRSWVLRIKWCLLIRGRSNGIYGEVAPQMGARH